MVQSRVTFVSRSSVRSSVLDALAADALAAAELVETLDASESAVYEALDRLADRGLVAPAGDDRGSADGGVTVWAATGAGVLVADCMRSRADVESLLDVDHDYWRTHDVTAVPPQFRRSLRDLGRSSVEVVRASDTDPNRAVRAVADHLSEADSVDVVAPVFHERYADAVANPGSEVRVVLAASVVDEFADDPPVSVETADVAMRVAEADVGLAVSDEAVLLSLPDRNGGYDPGAEVIARGSAAREWGRRLFEQYWASAPDVATYVSSRDRDATQKR